MQFIINYYNDIIIFYPTSAACFLLQEKFIAATFMLTSSIAGIYLLHQLLPHSCRHIGQ